MPNLDAILRDLVSEVEPTATQKNAAAASQRHLRRELEGDGFGDRIVDSFLSGSYARDTAVYPLDDVDVILEIDPKMWKTPWLRFESGPPPAAVLDSFEGALRRRYPENSIRKQRRSIRLELAHVHLDVVPAIGGHKDPEKIFIPDRTKDTWIETGPKKHSRIASELNQATDGRFKPIVKLAKWWNGNLADETRLKSFAIETAAARIFLGSACPSISDGLLRFFDFLSGFAGVFGKNRITWNTSFGTDLGWFSWGPSIPDLAGTGSNLVAAIGEEHRLRFLEEILVTRDRLLGAASAKNSGTAEARLRKALNMTE